LKKQRVGRKFAQKRSDKSFTSPDGQLWDSKYEHDVYVAIKGTGADVRKCDKSDSFCYHEPKKGGKCLACGSGDVVQERIYTPDLHVCTPPNGTDGGSSFFIEVKGYFRQQRRALFGHFLKSNKDVDIRILFEHDGKATAKFTYSEYVERYYKIPVVCGVSELLGSNWL